MSDNIDVTDLGGLRSDAPNKPLISNAGVALTTQNVLSTEKVKAFLSKDLFPEKEIPISKLLTRPVTLSYVNIPSTYLNNTLVWNFSFPQKIFDVSTSAQKFGLAYSFFKYAKIHILVTTLGSLDTCGSAIGAPCWDVGEALENCSIGTMASRDYMQILDFSDVSQNYKFEVPWRFPDDAAFLGITNAKEAQFDFKIVMLSPVNVSSRIVVTAWFEGGEMSVTRPGIQGSKISTIYNSYGTVEGSVNPNTRVGDDIDLANDMKFGGFHSPTDAMNPYRVEIMRNSYTSSADNVRFLERIALHPGLDAHARLSDFGTDVDEMSFDFIKSHWKWLGNFVYTTTTSLFLSDTGSRSSIFGVGPNAMLPTLGGTDYTAASYNIGPIDHICNNHQYWSGDIEEGCVEFLIKINSTRTQTGRLWFGYLPAVYDVSSLTYDQLTDTFGEHIDIGGPANEFIVKIPYLSPTARKYVYRGLWDAGTVAVGKNMTSQQYLSCFAGRAYIVAESPLISPTGAPTSIDISVFMRAAKGFKVFGPNGSTNWKQTTVPAVAPPAMVMAGEVTLSTDKAHITQHDMPPTLSYRDICRSYNVCARENIAKDDIVAGQWVYSECWMNPFNMALGGTEVSDMKKGYINPMNQCSAMYNGFKGSIRYRVSLRFAFTTTASHTGTPILVYPPSRIRAYLVNNFDGFTEALATGKLSTFKTTLTNSALPLDSSTDDYHKDAPQAWRPIAQSHSVDNIVNLEFEIPYNSVHKWLDFTTSPDLSFIYVIGDCFTPVTYQDIDVGAEMQIEVAFGDDARFGMYDGCYFEIKRPTATGSFAPIFMPVPPT